MKQEFKDAKYDWESNDEWQFADRDAERLFFFKAGARETWKWKEECLIRDRAHSELLLRITRQEKRIAELEDVLKRNGFHELSKNCWCLKSGGCL